MIEFDSEFGGFVDSGRLSEEHRAALDKRLPKPLTKEQREKFLSAVSRSVSVLEQEPQRLPMDAVKTQVEALENEARRLRAALGRFAGAPYQHVAPYFDYLVWGSDAPSVLPERYRESRPSLDKVLQELYEPLEALLASCEYARGKFVIKRTSKPSQDRARALVYHVARQYEAQFGTLPAYHKNGWFPGFIKALGEIVGTKTTIGPALVKSAVESMKEKIDPAV